MVRGGAGAEELKWQRGNWEFAGGHNTLMKDMHFMKMYVHFFQEILSLGDMS